NLRLHGHVSGREKERLFDDALAVIFPSECYENCPYGILEPLSRGIPVIGSNRGAIPELISDGENGWLFKGGDIQDLDDCMAQVIALSTSKRAAMREKIWANARKRFSLEKWVKEIENLYDSVSVKRS